MSMFGSIAQSTREDRLVLTVSASDSTFNFYDTSNGSNVLYEFKEVSNPSNNGSGELLNGPYNTTIDFPSNGIYKLYIRPSGSLYGDNQRMKPFFYNSPVENSNKLISIDNWGNYPFQSNSQYAFGRCQNIDILAPDCPLLYPSNDSLNNMDLTGWFYQSFSVENSNNSLSNWDISRVESITSMFQQTYSMSLNVNIEDWELGPNITNLASLFYGSHMSCSIATKLTTKYGKTYIAWDVSNITSLSYTFKGINASSNGGRMTGLGNWNTSNVYTLRGTFAGANSAAGPSQFGEDISTKQVTIGAGTTLETTYNAWDVSNVTQFGSTIISRYYEGTFFNSNFNQDISNWQINTGSGVLMVGMFCAAPKFNQPITGSTVTVGSNTYEAWNTKKVTSFKSAFYNVYHTRNTMSFAQPIGEWDVSSATDMSGMFQYNENFNQDLSKWNTSNVTTMGHMFRSTNMQYALSSSYQNHPTRGEYIAWDTSNVTDMAFMFQNNISVKVPNAGYNQNINNWNVSQVISMRGMFAGDSNTTASFNQDISTKQVTVGAGTSLETTYNAWDVSKVTQFAYTNDTTNTSFIAHGMFAYNSYFNQPIGNWQINTGSTVFLRDMFYNAFTFNQPISQSNQTVGSNTYEAWNVKKVISLRSTFTRAQNFNQNINNWNISSSTSLYYTFHRALNFNQPLNLWNTSNVTTLAGMFYSSPFDQPLSSSYQNPSDRDEYIAWDTSKVTNMSFMFFNFSRDNSNPDPGFNQDVNNWNTSNVTNLQGTFAGVNQTHTASFNQDISTKQVTIGAGTTLETTYNAWDVSNVTNFGTLIISDNNAYQYYGTFAHNRHFNQPIGNWQINTGSNVSFRSMFNYTNFNQHISSSIQTVGSNTYTAWDTKKVNTTRLMFSNNNVFNKPIGNWNLISASSLEEMFYNSYAFNQDISASIQTVGSETYNAWYLKNTTDLSSLFFQALAFNKPIGNWYVNNVNSFSQTFYNTDSYQHSLATQSVSLNGVSYTSWDIGTATFNNMFYFSEFDMEGVNTWDVSNVTSFGAHFMNQSGLTTENYDNILVNWSSSLGINPNNISSINFGTTKYTGTLGSNPSASHAFIEDDLEITLTDGGPV